MRHAAITLLTCGIAMTTIGKFSSDELQRRVDALQQRLDAAQTAEQVRSLEPAAQELQRLLTEELARDQDVLTRAQRDYAKKHWGISRHIPGTDARAFGTSVLAPREREVATDRTLADRLNGMLSSLEDRAALARFGFAAWHKRETAHYGRGQEHAVLVMAARTAGVPVERAVEVQAAIDADGAGGYANAMLALGVLLADGSPEEARRLQGKISPVATGLGRPDIHPNPGSCIAAGAMISNTPAADALRIYEQIGSVASVAEREQGHLALACLLTGRSPAEVVATYEQIMKREAHAGVAGALTIAVAIGDAPLDQVLEEWSLVAEQDLCGPVDAALLVAGGHLTASRRG